MVEGTLHRCSPSGESTSQRHLPRQGRSVQIGASPKVCSKASSSRLRLAQLMLTTWA